MPASPASRLALFYGATFLAAGVQLPFWPVWLKSRGLSAAEIGLLLAVGIWIKVAATPLVGMAADRTNRRVLMIGLALASLGAYLLLLPDHGFPALLLIATTATTCAAALSPLGENATLSASKAGKLDYGRVRLWGSLSFIVAVLGSGYLVSDQEADLILLLIAAATGLTVLACFAIPAEGKERKRAKTGNWRALFGQRHLLFLGAALLVQASHSVYYAFGSLYWTALGFSSSTIAWLWVEGVVAEIALFYWGGPLVRRIGPLKLLALGGAGGALRWAVTGFTADLGMLALLQLFHALSFGAAHLGAMHQLARSVPAEQSATGQALYSAAVSGFGFGFATLLSGPLYAAYGGGAYLAMAAMAAGGAVIALMLNRGDSAAAK